MHTSEVFHRAVDDSCVPVKTSTLVKFSRGQWDDNSVPVNPSTFIVKFDSRRWVDGGWMMALFL